MGSGAWPLGVSVYSASSFRSLLGTNSAQMAACSDVHSGAIVVVLPILELHVSSTERALWQRSQRLPWERHPKPQRQSRVRQLKHPWRKTCRSRPAMVFGV